MTMLPEIGIFPQVDKMISLYECLSRGTGDCTSMCLPSELDITALGGLVCGVYVCPVTKSPHDHKVQYSVHLRPGHSRH